MYIFSHRSAIMSVKMWFIKDWKVDGPLQKLKNLTVGSKSAKGVMNAPFHWSSSRMQMLLNPHQMSNLVKIKESFMSSINLGIRGRGYALQMVWEFR